MYTLARCLSALIVLVFAAGAAFGQVTNGSAPEVDPTVLAGALALLVGGVSIFAAKRAKK